jgi:hypothetical protein
MDVNKLLKALENTYFDQTLLIRPETVMFRVKVYDQQLVSFLIISGCYIPFPMRHTKQMRANWFKSSTLNGPDTFFLSVMQ